MNSAEDSTNDDQALVTTEQESAASDAAPSDTVPAVRGTSSAAVYRPGPFTPMRAALLVAGGVNLGFAVLIVSLGLAHLIPMGWALGLAAATGSSGAWTIYRGFLPFPDKRK